MDDRDFALKQVDFENLLKCIADCEAAARFFNQQMAVNALYVSNVLLPAKMRLEAELKEEWNARENAKNVAAEKELREGL